MIQHKRLIHAVLALLFAALACSSPVTAAPTLPPSATAPAAPAEILELPATSTPAPTREPVDPAAGDPVPPATLSETFQPFWETWEVLHDYFVDQPLDETILVQGAMDGLLNHADIAENVFSDEAAQAFSTAAETPEDASDAFLAFWHLWINASGESEVMLMRHALNGMVDSLGDQHTSYMDPDQYQEALIPLDGTYEGIGAFVDADGEYLTIVSPIPGSPAEAAGLQPGDQVIKVDSEDMTGIDGNLVRRRVLGPAGTDVTLTIRREGVADFDVVITRAEITIPSVTGEILEGTNLAYVQLLSFGDTTGDEMHEILVELLARNPDGLILDLRGNGGGYVDTAVQISSEFIADGVIFYEVFGDGSRETYQSLGDGLATDIPLVVLVDEGSASASEILAGAIQDYGRGTLVGTVTFGKGSVQNWLDLTDGGALRVTIARWHTPNDRLIHEIGLTPDVIVEITDEDVTAGRDPQLDKAIELLTQE
jgi:carboxyl-terminal processing protease